MGLASRIWPDFVGAVLVIVGALMLYAFQSLARREHDTWFDIAGTALIVEAYSIVASLFVLLGLRYAFGPRSFIERAIAHTVRHFTFAVILLSLVIAAVGLFLLR